MAAGQVTIDAGDWARIEVALAAIPEIQKDMAELKARSFCVEHEACAKAAFGARKFQYLILGGLIVLNAVLIPAAIAVLTR
jgi:hypothetical protein